MIEINITSLIKAKTRKRVWVKPTATKKGYYREQEVGQKEIEKKPPRKDTGKIASLPEDIKKEILELRRIGYSGTKIKEHIEGMITQEIPATGKVKDELESIRDRSIMLSREAAKKDNTPERREYLRRKSIENIKQEHDLRSELIGEPKIHIDGKLIDSDVAEKIITEDGKLKVTGQSLVDWASARGVESKKKRKTVKAVEEKAKEIEETRFKEANEKLARLQTENKMLQEQLDRERKSKMESDELRNKLNNENYILREKLKLLNKPVKETGKEADNKKLVSQYTAGMEHASRHLK